MANTGNYGNNTNQMFRTPNLLKHQITGGAEAELSKLIDLLDYNNVPMQILKRVPRTSVRRWTDLSKECYERGCNCQGCVYYRLFQSLPQCIMKATVLELVRTLGIPEGAERIEVIND